MFAPLISIVTINYNSTNFTKDFLKSLGHCTYKNIEIFVVDNASEEPPIILKDEFPHINLILSNENLGFAGGNNLAIKMAKGKYVFLLNNDTEVAANFLEPIVSLMESNTNIGIASSKLVYSENNNLIQFAGSYGINYYTGRAFAIGYKQKDTEKFSTSYKTQLAHGAAMLINTEVFKKVGLMAELYFLYYEEVDFCERVKREGYEIWYCGASKVFHKESMSIGKESALKVYYLTRNRMLFLRRNTFGKVKLFVTLYFYFIAVPKGIFKYFITFNFKLLIAFVKGAFWNIKNYNIYQNTGLVIK